MHLIQFKTTFESQNGALEISKTTKDKRRKNVHTIDRLVRNIN